MNAYLGEAAALGLLRSFVSLAFASETYIRSHLVDFRVAVPIALVAVVLSPLGTQGTPFVEKAFFSGFIAPSSSSPAR